MDLTYEEALSFIHGIGRLGSKPGLRRIKMLLELMGNPQDRLRYIHVAGTNGKGSTCAMLSHILKHAGYRTGLYISPYVIEFRERIQVNNEMVSRDDLVSCVEFAKPFWEELDAGGEPPTEFELVVAVAFEYFLRQRCDVVVLEVGMGGRFDSTNIISTPLVSVITSIDIDHTKYLGNTIREIAFEKCGIIKRGGITVSYPGQHPDALAVIMERCAQEENRLLIPGSPEVLSIDEYGSDIAYDGMRIHIPLVGGHQISNAMTVLETVRALETTTMGITLEDAKAGIGETSFPCRFERFGKEPLLILDGAHNASGAQVLGKALDLLGRRRIHLVMAMMADKDADGWMREILPRCENVTVTTVPNFPKACPAGDLGRAARRHHGNVALAERPADAFVQTLSRCGREDVLLVCGSLYLMSEIRPLALKYDRGEFDRADCG